MKKLLLCFALLLGLVLVSSTTAVAALLIHDAGYHWRSGGTRVIQSWPVEISFNVGNPTPPDIIQVFEKAYDNGYFTWWVVNDAFEPLIYSFHVQNQGLVPTAHTEPDDWEFDYDDTSFWWDTYDAPLTLPGSGINSATFTVTVPTGLWAINTASVNDEYGDFYNEDGFWVASHPAIPEPASMLLFGMGILGLFGLKKKVLV